MDVIGHIILSDKYKLFLTVMDAVFEILEGTTASGKTTVGIIKFLIKVMLNPKKQHVIAGNDIGTIEKNIICSEFGVLKVFGNKVKFYPKGHGAVGIPHISITRGGVEKIVLLLGYDTEARWKKALGGQYGCVFCDEMNTASMSFLRQIVMRCDYFMGTLNPDDPDKEVYKEFINRCRPLPQCVGDAPEELEAMLNEPAMNGWIWWYFSFDDNAGLTEEKKEKIKSMHMPGSAEYLHYILGMRGKAEGVIFDNFNRTRHIITEGELIKKVECQNVKYDKGLKPDEKFIIFSAGLDTAYSSKSDDTIAFSFIGITNKRNIYVLDEEVYNNKDSKVVYAPSNIAEKYYKFLEKNRQKWGFAQNAFVDSADQATLSEFKILKNKKGLIYNFNNAWKKLKIIDRIQLQKGWIATDNFYVLENCKNYIRELQIYSWSEKENKTIPEDKNDHMINSVQYAWIPFKEKIGNITEV